MLADLTIEQWIVAGVGAALAAAMFIVNLSSGAGLTRRRRVALLIVAAAVGTAVWTLGGGALRMPRNTVLIASCRTDEALLEGLARELLGRRRGKLVLFSASSGNGCAAMLRGLANRLGRTPTRARLVSLAERGTLTGLDHLVQSAQATAAFDWSYLFESLLDLPATPTVVFLYDRASPDWTSALSTDGIATSELLQNPDLFVRDVADAALAATLRVTLPPTLHADVPLRWINAPMSLTINGGPGGWPDRLTIDLCITLNGTTDFAGCQAEKAPDRILLRDVPLHRVAGPTPVWRWVPDPGTDKALFDDLLSEGRAGTEQARLHVNALHEGWNNFEFRARVTSGRDAGMVLPARQVYVRAGADGATIIVGEERLAGLTWPLPQAAAAVPVLTAAWLDVPDDLRGFRRLRGLPMPPTVLDAKGSRTRCLLRAGADEAVVNACLKRSKALILIEPDAALLARATTRGWPQAITKAGGAVLVAAPAEVDAATAATVADWLPALPAGTGASDPVRIVRTRRIVAVGDCSGLAQMPVSDAVPAMRDSASPRPVDLQDAILSEFVKHLTGASDVTVSPVMAGASGTADVLQIEGTADWRAPLQVGTSVSCIRLSDRGDINEPRDLLDFAQVEARLHALLLNSGDAPFAAGNRYPGSVVIVFTTLAPQAPVRALQAERLSAAFVPAGALPPTWAPSTAGGALQRLASAGIAVILVQLPTNPRLAAKALAESSAAETTTFETAAAAWQAAGLVRRISVDAATPATTAADRIMQELASHEAQTTMAVSRVAVGRSLDPRFPARPVSLPLAYTALAPISGAARVLALVSSVPPEGSAVDDPLIVERRLGNGTVVVLGYSPFGPHEFASDMLFRDFVEPALRATCGAQCALAAYIDNSVRATRMAGQLSSALGLQRVIDILEQSTRGGQSPDLPQLVDVLLSDAGDALDVVFAIPPGLTGWRQPVAVLPDAGAHCPLRETQGTCPLNLAAFDPVAGRATYRLTTERTGGLERGTYDVALGAGSDAVAAVPIALRSRSSNDSAESRLLGTLSALGAIPIRGELPGSERSVMEVATLLLLGMAACLFSPLVRPWHAFRRFRQRVRRSEDTLENALDADAIIERTATIASVYEASRRAGDPAWIRPFVAGDSLSRALVLDLVAFTSEGKRQNFVLRPPRVRLREMRETFDVVIGVDDTPALLHPGDGRGLSRKRAATSLLIDTIAAAVTQQSGRWILVGLRDSAPLGPVTGRDPDAVEEFLAARLSRAPDGTAIGPASAKIGDAALLLISDFLAAPLVEYIGWLGTGRSSAILLTDAEQEQEIGFGVDAASGAFYDRSAWDTADAAELLRLHHLEVREALERSGTPIAVVDMDLTDIEIADVLIQSGVLRFVQQ